MYATVQKWGNSQGIRIPRVLLDAVDIRENDRVELIPHGDGIEIKRLIAVKHRTLEDRLTSFYGMSVDEIERIPAGPELDWGKAEGSEIW